MSYIIYIIRKPEQKTNVFRKKSASEVQEITHSLEQSATMETFLNSGGRIIKISKKSKSFTVDLYF
jgi:hypothetical protein